jgi:hypothetical protein
MADTYYGCTHTISTVRQAERRAAQLGEQAAALERSRADAAQLQELLFY